MRTCMDAARSLPVAPTLEARSPIRPSRAGSVFLLRDFWGYAIMFLTMSQDNLIKFECAECKRIGYFSHKNKKTIKVRLELSKFCKWCKKHTAHKETK